ncbi:MAG: glycoside hydrolase family 15 protein [Bacillota bacterium]
MRRAFLGNGSLALGFDGDLRLREMFWPKVGLRNHIQEGRECRLLLWRGGTLLPVGGRGWDVSGAYCGGMSFAWRAENREHGVAVIVTDTVDPFAPVWARTVEVECPDGEGPLSLYSLSALALDENTVGESAAWDREAERLYHYKGGCWVAIQFTGNAGPSNEAVASAVVSKVRDGGVHVSLETGIIHGQAVDHGLIESAAALRCESAAFFRANFLTSFGRTREEADRRLNEAGYPEAVKLRSERRWRGLDDEQRVSVMTVVSHADRGGGIVASCDTDIQGDYRDHYRYVWHRDAAMCVGALLRVGLHEYAERYLRFCSKSIDSRGFFWQRHRVDGTRGSGWHPWNLEAGSLPVQEDETALSLILAGDYRLLTGDLAGLEAVYRPFVRRAARFLSSYTTDGGKLVRPSFDLWEERRGIFSFTQAACAGALFAAAEIAGDLSAADDREEFLSAARLLLEGLVLRLSSEESGFCRGLLCGHPEDCDPKADWTPDASLFLIPLILPAPLLEERDSGSLGDTLRRRSVSTWRRVSSALGVLLPGKRVPGYARYTGDWYFRPEGAGGLPGNPWPVCTAWRALAGRRLGELSKEEFGEHLRWFSEVAGESGILPEQLDCVTGEHRSVSPLAWSHAMHLELLSARGAPPGHTSGPSGRQ